MKKVFIKRFINEDINISDPALTQQYLAVEKQIADKQTKKAQQSKIINQIDNEINILQKNLIAIKQKDSSNQQKSQPSAENKQNNNNQHTQTNTNQVNQPTQTNQQNTQSNESYTGQLKRSKKINNYREKVIDYIDKNFHDGETIVHEHEYLLLKCFNSQKSSKYAANIIMKLAKSNEGYIGGDNYNKSIANATTPIKEHYNYLNELEQLPPKPKEQILKDLALLPKEKLNKLLLNTAYEGSLVRVRYLLDAGADVEVKDNDGQTALMIASWYGYKEVVQVLLAAGADVEVKDNDGWTALMYALKYKYKEIVQILRNAGAKKSVKENLNESVYNDVLNNIQKEIDKLSDIKTYIENYDDNSQDDLQTTLQSYKDGVSDEVTNSKNPFTPSEDEKKVDETLKAENKEPFTPALIENKDIENELEMMNYEEEDEQTDNYVFYIRVNSNEDNEIIAKVYKENIDDNWVLRVVKGDEEPLQSIEFDNRLNKLEIISYIADMFQEVEIMDPKEYEYLLNDKEKIDNTYYTKEKLEDF
jgi:hypothetical protein